MGDLPGREHGVGSEVGRDAQWRIRGPALLIALLAEVTLVLGTSYWLIGDFSERQV